MKISDILLQANTTQYVNQTNSTHKDQASQEVNNKPSSTEDKVELSAQSKEMQKIYDALQATPDVRAEKVAALRQLIQEDRYQVDSGAVADKMIQSSITDLIK